MGKTLVPLASSGLKTKAIFNNRFVIEAVEDFHIHYRNLRISLNKADFVTICQGVIQAFERWNMRGCPENPPKHIELCRKTVAVNKNNDNIRINLNENLYNKNEGKIYAEGAEFKDDTYIHLKIRDIRIEMSKDEFKELSDCVAEATRRLESSDTHTSVQA